MQIESNLDFSDYRILLLTFLFLFIIIFLRYIVLSGAYHWIFLVVFRKRFKEGMLSAQVPKSKQVKRELLYSTYSAIIFSAMGIILLLLWQNGYTKIYIDTLLYPYWYSPVSIIIFLLLHDSYYYWLHRGMHTFKWMRRFHMEHHKSVDTTVFTSFSFHPVESFLQALVIPIILVILPMNPIAILVALLVMTVSAIVNHAGVEILPRNGTYRKLHRFLIGATHHDIHHKNSRRNFGLYFTFWDRFMKTEL